MLISIVVPIYNKENYIERCLNSLKKQEYKEIEIIMVNDGSNDSSEEKCKLFLEDSRFKLLNKTNGGLVSAVISGIMASKGKYICFVDADDFVGEDFILNFINNLKDDYDIVSLGFNYFKNNIKTPFVLNDIIINDTSMLIKSFIITNNLELDNSFFIARWNKMYKKDVLMSAISNYSQIKDLSIGEDTLLNYFVLLNNPSINSVSKVNSYYYDISTDSMGRKRDNYTKYLYIINKTLSVIAQFSKYQEFEYIKYCLIYIISMNYINSNSKTKDSKTVKEIMHNNFYNSSLLFLAKRIKFNFKSKIKFLILKFKMSKIYIFLQNIKK